MEDILRRRKLVNAISFCNNIDYFQVHGKKTCPSELNPISAVKDLELISRYGHYSKLHCSNFTLISKEPGEILSHNRELKEIRFKNVVFGPSGAKSIAKALANDTKLVTL